MVSQKEPLEEQEPPAISSHLVDPAALADLVRDGGTALDNVLRRVVDEAAENLESISGWSSFIDDD